MTEVTVEAAEIGTVYRDQGTSAKTTRYFFFLGYYLGTINILSFDIIVL